MVANDWMCPRRIGGAKTERSPAGVAIFRASRASDPIRLVLLCAPVDLRSPEPLEATRAFAVVKTASVALGLTVENDELALAADPRIVATAAALAELAELAAVAILVIRLEEEPLFLTWAWEPPWPEPVNRLAARATFVMALGLGGTDDKPALPIRVFPAFPPEKEALEPPLCVAASAISTEAAQTVKNATATRQISAGSGRRL